MVLLSLDDEGPEDPFLESLDRFSDDFLSGKRDQGTFERGDRMTCLLDTVIKTIPRLNG